MADILTGTYCCSDHYFLCDVEEALDIADVLDQVEGLCSLSVFVRLQRDDSNSTLIFLILILFSDSGLCNFQHGAS